MRLSVVIPTLDEAAEIGPGLRHLRAVAPGAEVLVVDGGSGDGTVEAARAEGAEVLTGVGRGRARQMNAAAARCAGEHLLFLHVDTRLPVGVEAHVARTLRDPGVALGAFAFRLRGERPLYRAMERVTNLRARALSLPYGDQALFLRREDFVALGGYAELRILEDLDLVVRARRLGRVEVVSAPAVTSARKYEAHGAWRVIAQHGALAARYALGWRPGAPP